MALGAEVGLGPGDIVLDKNPVPPPLFGPCIWWPNSATAELLLTQCSIQALITVRQSYNCMLLNPAVMFL